MDPYNMEQVTQVWERVQNTTTHTVYPEEHPIARMEWMARHTAREYARLAGCLGGCWGRMLRCMACEEWEDAAVLGGMKRMAGCTAELGQWEHCRECPKQMLRRLAERSQEAWQDYHDREEDPHFGAAFTALAKRERYRQRRLLLILDGMK